MLNLKSILSLALSSCALLPLCVQAKIPESRMINYEKKISLTNEQKINLEKLANTIHAESFKKLYSSDGWGKYGKFSDLGMEVQGSLAYGMALADSSDLDIAFIYKYNNGDSMTKFDPVQFKKIAIDSFKSTFGSKYTYTIKAPVVNLKNQTEDIDIAFFNILSQSTMLCSTANRCSELNYGKDSATAAWYKSERLSLYSKLDEVFSVNTEKRNLINRAGKIFKVWRSKTFSTQTVKVPSIALVTIMYDFEKDNKNPVTYSSSIEMLRDMTHYGIIKYFKDKSCSGASSAEINLPVYQTDRNLLNRLNSAQRVDFCKKLVKFNEVLAYSASGNVSEVESVKALEPFIGSL